MTRLLSLPASFFFHFSPSLSVSAALENFSQCIRPSPPLSETRFLSLSLFTFSTSRYPEKNTRCRDVPHVLSMAKKISGSLQPVVFFAFASPSRLGFLSALIYQAKKDASPCPCFLLSSSSSCSPFVSSASGWQAVTLAAVELRERLGEENACAKLFRIQVKFGSSRVEFDPSLDQFQAALRDLWEGTRVAPYMYTCIQWTYMSIFTDMRACPAACSVLQCL